MCVEKRLIFFAIWLTIFVHFQNKSDAKDLYTFILSNVICKDADPSVTYNFSCNTRAINRTTKASNISIVFAPNVSFAEIYVRVNLFVRGNAGYRRSIIDMEEDFCGFVAGTSKSFLISILWEDLKRQGNIGHPCPFTGVVDIRDLVISDQLFPPYLPEGQIKLDIHVTNGLKRISIIRVIFYGEIKPKGAFKLVL